MICKNPLFINKYIYIQRDPSVAKKDLDAIKNKIKLKLNSEQATVFIQQLKQDSEFFKANSIIDYSMLIGIHYKFQSKEKKENHEDFIKIKKFSNSIKNMTKNEVFN